MSILDELLTNLEKKAEAENKPENKEGEKNAAEHDYSDDEKAKMMKEKKDKDSKDKDMKDKDMKDKGKEKMDYSEKQSALIKKLSDLSVEKLAALENVINNAEEAEKKASLEKQAEDLETQGRFMYHGFAKEQIKVSHALGEIDDKQVIKIAETLKWDLNEIFKSAAPDLPGKDPEPKNEGEGTMGGPASDEIKAPGKRIAPADSNSQKERKIEGDSELGELKSIINDVKAVKQEAANLEYNDANH